MENIQKIATAKGYNFYTGTDKEGKPLYNVIPVAEGEPAGGYYNPRYICKVKCVPNLFEESKP